MFNRFVVLIALVFVTACEALNNGSQDINLAYPTAQPSLSVSLQIGNGSLVVSPSEGGGITGSTDTNVPEWRPETTNSGGQITLRQGRISEQVIFDSYNNWNLQIGKDKPLALTVSNRDANATLELGGLSLQGLTLQGRDGDARVTFAAPNPITGIVGQVTMRQGNLTLDDLLNSGIRQLNTESTSGDQSFIFDGQTLQDTMNVNARTSTGEVVIRLAANIPAQVTFRTTSGVVQQTDMSVFVAKGNRVYETNAFATTEGARLFIEVLTVTGDVRLLGN